MSTGFGNDAGAAASLDIGSWLTGNMEGCKFDVCINRAEAPTTIKGFATKERGEKCAKER